MDGGGTWSGAGPPVVSVSVSRAGFLLRQAALHSVELLCGRIGTKTCLCPLSAPFPPVNLQFSSDAYAGEMLSYLECALLRRHSWKECTCAVAVRRLFGGIS